MMNNSEIERDDVCRNRIIKTDKELSRICPSKLSKRELEDLYFVLLESNLELKRTVNSQNDKIKVLSTKLLRMTAGQKSTRGETPGCCVSSRIVEEQKDSIVDLKRENAQLAERIKQLNMRLCSARQFLKRCPAQSVSRTGCNKSANGPRSAVSVKNSSTSALDCNRSVENIRMSSATSCQFLNKDTNDAQTETVVNANQEGAVCNNNQCRTRMEELKQKILNLQDELVKTHEEYSSRISRLEHEVSELQHENMRVRSVYAADQQNRCANDEEAKRLTTTLREQEAQSSDLTLQLTLERRKVAELETRIKAAQLSREVLKALEDHLDTIQEENQQSVHDIPQKCCEINCACQQYVHEKQSKDVTCCCPLSNSDLVPGSQSQYDCSIFDAVNRQFSKDNVTKPPDAHQLEYERQNVDGDLNKANVQELVRIGSRHVFVGGHSFIEPKCQSFHSVSINPSDESIILNSILDDNNQSNGENRFNEECRGCLPDQCSSLKKHKPLDSNDKSADRNVSYLPIKNVGDNSKNKTEESNSGVIKGQIYNNNEMTGQPVERNFVKKDDCTNETHNTMCGVHDTQLNDGSCSQNVKCNDELNIENLVKIKQDLAQKIADLQAQLDSLKLLVINHVNKQENNDKVTSDNISTSDDENKVLEVTSKQLAKKTENKTVNAVPAKKYKGLLEDDETKKHPIQPSSSKGVVKTPIFPRKPIAAIKNVEKTPEKEPKSIKDNHNSYQIPGPLPTGPTKGDSKRLPVKKVPTKMPVSEKQKSLNDGRRSRSSSFGRNEDIIKERTVLNTQCFDQKQLTTERGVQTDGLAGPADTPRQKTGTSDTLDWSKPSNFSRPRLSEQKDAGNVVRTYNACSTQDKFVQTDSFNEQRNGISEREGQLARVCSWPASLVSVAEVSCGRCVCCQYHSTAVETAPNLTIQGNNEVRNQQDSSKQVAKSSRFINSSTRESDPYRLDLSEQRNNDQSITRQQQARDQNVHSQRLLENQIHPAVVPQKQIYKTNFEQVGQQMNQNQLKHQLGKASMPQSVSAQTYTLQERRAGSPEDTDKEISSYSDLPLEKDRKIFRKNTQSPDVISPLSPGQHPGLPDTDTDYTYTEQPYSITLSEGEVPTERRARQLSIGEQPTKDIVPGQELLPRRQSTQHMEATLNAISEELSRCRRLLRRPPGQYSEPKDEAVMVDLCHSSIPLKRADGKSRIGDTFSPKCVFILHIGTVVLSDEAVSKARGCPLALRWRFYGQPLSGVRVRASRVIHFHFSTEYDVRLTPQLLNYLQHEEMPIVICELDKQKPFASCTLPLREALQHANERTDMSLPLTSGAPGHDGGAAFGGAGVLDLWCALRGPPHMDSYSSPPPLKTTIEDNRPTTAVDNATVHSVRQMAEVDDGQSVDTRLFDDLDLDVDKRCDMSLMSNDNLSMAHMEYEPKRRRQSRSSCMSKKSCRYNDNQSESSFHGKRDFYMPLQTERIQNEKRQSHTSQTQKSFIDSDLLPSPVHSDRMDPLGFTHLPQTSGMILNEVPTNVKSVNDMKHKLQKNVLVSSVNEMPSYGKRSGNLSDPQSSLLSLNKDKDTGSMDDFLQNDNWKRLSKFMIQPRNESAEREKNKDVDDIRADENLYSKKSVTIESPVPFKNRANSDKNDLNVDITIVWLALNEECSAMNDPKVRRLYVAYSFLGRAGAELETPVSLPKPKCYVDKCYFNFKKTFKLHEADLPVLGHLAKCKSPKKGPVNPNDCVTFTVVSEPPEDPLGLDNCEDIGAAHLYLGDILSCCDGDSYTEVVAVRARAATGVLAVRVDGLDVVRRCAALHATDDR